MSSAPKKVLAIGGTGAQGVPVVKGKPIPNVTALPENPNIRLAELARDGAYQVQVLTRNPESESAKSLVSSSANITLIQGDPFNANDLRSALTSVDAVFVNTNGFAIGEKAEIYWGIRTYEIAAGSGVKHFVYATLDYASKLGGFDPKFHTGHLDGKGIVAEYVRAQPTERMGWTLFHSAPYLETLSEMLKPKIEKNADSNETFVFEAPLGDAAMPLIALDDLGKYGRWVFDNFGDGKGRSNGLTLGIGTQHITWTELASVFSQVTGKKARYRPLTLSEYFASGVFPDPERKVGHSIDNADHTLQTYRENFSGFWTWWASGLAERDYALLDEIFPERMKTVKEWMERTGYTGERKSVLKDYSDIAKKMAEAKKKAAAAE